MYVGDCLDNVESRPDRKMVDRVLVCQENTDVA
jgi:hypothetical protein